MEDTWEPVFPSLVGTGHVLPGVGLDGRDGRNVGRETGGVDERRARTGEILHAEKHLVLLPGGSHQHLLALHLAGLQRHSGITHLARQHQALEIGERLVNDHRLQLRGRMHHILTVRFQVARSGLFDVLNTLETLGGLLLHTAQEIDKVFDVRTLLIEIKRIKPS